MTGFDDFEPHVDWRGFTELDFCKMKANKRYDPQYQFNREFYAGDLKLQIRDSMMYADEKHITFWFLDDEEFPDSHNITSSNTVLSMEVIEKMSYKDFQSMVEAHLCFLIRESELLTMDEKHILAVNMDKQFPEKWADEYLLDLISLSRQLIRKGKTLSDIEQDWVIPNDRANILLFGSSENLMQQLDANLRKQQAYICFPC